MGPSPFGERPMRQLKTRIAAATIAAGLACGGLPAAAQTYYTINGQAAPYDVQIYMAQNGLPAGNYVSRYGSGEQGSNGWSHYDNMSGTSVGGDSNGCYYADDWSNC